MRRGSSQITTTGSFNNTLLVWMSPNRWTGVFKPLCGSFRTWIVSWGNNVPVWLCSRDVPRSLRRNVAVCLNRCMFYLHTKAAVDRVKYKKLQYHCFWNDNTRPPGCNHRSKQDDRILEVISSWSAHSFTPPCWNNGLTAGEAAPRCFHNVGSFFSKITFVILCENL